MPEYFYPPQPKDMELDTVYRTIHQLGGALYTPATHAGGVNQFVYGAGDATAPLVGTPAGSITFDQCGKIDGILDGAPCATFHDIDSQIDLTISLNDPLQMSGGGTWLTIMTHTRTSEFAVPVYKGTRTDPAGNGYTIVLNPDGSIRFKTSDNGSTQTECISASGVFAVNERIFVASTLALDGTAKLYLNGTLIATQTGMQIPSNLLTPMVLGNSRSIALDRQVGIFELYAQIPAVGGVVLTQPQIAIIASQCGRLGVAP